MEHGCVSHVGVATIHAPRADHPKRWFTGCHRADLNRRGMGAQQSTRIKIEGVVHGTSRVMTRNIECFEVMVIVFDLRALLNCVAGTGKELLNSLQGARNRM